MSLSVAAGHISAVLAFENSAAVEFFIGGSAESVEHACSKKAVQGYTGFFSGEQV